MKGMLTKKRFLLLCMLIMVMQFMTGCGKNEFKTVILSTESGQELTTMDNGVVWGDLVSEGLLPLEYAKQFTAERFEGGYSLLTVGDDMVEKSRFLVVPENAPVPEQLDADIQVLQQPLDHIYLAATSAMDLFRALDAIGSVRLSGTRESGWYIEEAREAMQQGEMLFAGKYSTPDYELIVNEGCDLAIESTMISHTPETKEQLLHLGIPVVVERSSYENHPLARMEWIKFYGVILGKEDMADTVFRQHTSGITKLELPEGVKPTVAYFAINANDMITVHKSGDYLVKMIELAGGSYAFEELTDDSALSTMRMEMESFYAGAKDADILVYNSTIQGELQTLGDLLAKNQLLADFKAVKEGRVYCTGQNLFQESMGLADMIKDLHTVMMTTEADDTLTYLHPLK